MKLTVEQSISGCHCQRVREQNDRLLEQGEWEPTGVHSYSGQLLHLAVTRKHDKEQNTKANR